MSSRRETIIRVWVNAQNGLDVDARGSLSPAELSLACDLIKKKILEQADKKVEVPFRPRELA